MPSKLPPADGRKTEPTAASDLPLSMQSGTVATRRRPVPAARFEDAALDALLRRELSKAHDWILTAPVPARLLRALRGDTES